MACSTRDLIRPMGQSTLGAKIDFSRWGSKRPGRLMPMPSNERPRWAANIFRIARRMVPITFRGFAGSPTASSERIFPPRSITANVVCAGCMSKASTPRCPLRSRKVGFLPRGLSPIDPSMIQRSARSSSTMSETVLRCRPEARAKSAREIGRLVRIWLKMRFRLIWRAIRFDALKLPFVKKRDGGIFLLLPPPQ